MQYRVIVVAAKAESGCCSAPPPRQLLCLESPDADQRSC